MIEETYMEELSRLQRQFLIHSYLYYEMNENVIDDSHYDRICKQMVRLMKEPEAVDSPFFDLCEPCGGSGSGFYIEDYPPNIITTALRQLYFHKKPPEDFGQFVRRWGFRLL